MAESNFVDYVKIYCRSGKGGRGSTHMRREKYCPNGGPDGGDGGRGGHIILRGNRNYWTLLHLKFDRHAMAGHGESGSKNRSFGKDGADKIIEVPCGTVVYNAETGEYLCDVTEDGQEVILLRGGRGGQGNWHFKTATRQAPRFAQPGEPMQEMTVIMELKLLADVFRMRESLRFFPLFRLRNRRLPTIRLLRSNRTWASFPIVTVNHS